MTPQFTIPRTELLKASRAMSKVINRRNKIPVLGYCLIEISAGRVSFSATDLDREVTLTFEADTSGKGSMMIDAAMLRSICAAVSGDVKFSKGSETITVTDGDAVITINDIMAADDYPGLHKRWTGDHDDNASSVTIAQTDLHRLFRLSRHCIGSTETRFRLMGLFLTTKPCGKTLRGVSTDGHRMAIIDTDCEVSGDMAVIVPTKTLNLIAHLIDKNANELVSIATHGTVMQFHKDGVLVTAKLIDGTYPDYTKPVPKESDAITVNLGADGLKRVAAFASDLRKKEFSGPALRIDAEKGQMSVKSPSGDRITFPCQVRADNETALIAYNIGYLLEQSIVTPSFRLRTASAFDPAIIDSDDPNAFWILMPVRS